MSSSAIAKKQVQHIKEVSEVPTKRRCSMTELDIQAAECLRHHWLLFKRKTGVIQSEFAASLGWSQGNFSQYLNGKAPLGLEATKKLAEALGINPGDIRKELRMDSYIEASKVLIETIREIRKTIGGEEVHKIINQKIMSDEQAMKHIYMLGNDAFSALFNPILSE